MNECETIFIIISISTYYDHIFPIYVCASLSLFDWTVLIEFEFMLNPVAIDKH